MIQHCHALDNTLNGTCCCVKMAECRTGTQTWTWTRQMMNSLHPRTICENLQRTSVQCYWSPAAARIVSISTNRLWRVGSCRSRPRSFRTCRVWSWTWTRWRCWIAPPRSGTPREPATYVRRTEHLFAMPHVIRTTQLLSPRSAQNCKTKKF